MRRPPVALLAVLTLVGFLFVITGSATSVANQKEEPRKRALISQILKQRRNVDDLDKAVAEVRGRVEGAQNRAGLASQQASQENQTLQALALDAGTVAVKGSGITVRLSDAAKPAGGDSVKFDASRIQDADLQLVVNALFAAGAEAVAINDNRVVAVTPIRAAGGTIVVNYRPVNSPYRVVAIGADQSRFNASEVALHFREWKKKFDLGYTVEKHGNLTAPAYSGSVAIDIAQAGTTTTSTTAPQRASSPSSTRVKR